MSLSPDQRRLRASIAALTMHAKNDTMVVSAPGRRAAAEKLDARLLAEVDPDGILPEAERARRLALARRAHFARLSFKSSKAREAKATADLPGMVQDDVTSTHRRTIPERRP